MTTSTAHPSPFRASARVPLRIQLDNGYRSGPLDGGDLVDHFPHLVGRPSRLLFSRPDWEDGGEPPVRRLPVASGVVKVGSFPGDDTHEMVLVMSSRERLRLLVVPHDVPAETAHRLLLEAADERNTRTASELLADALSQVPPPAVDTTGEDDWEDEGGAQRLATGSAGR